MDTVMTTGQAADAGAAIDAIPMNDTTTETGSRETVGTITVDNPRIVCRNLNVYYEDKHAIRDVSIDIGKIGRAHV